MRIEQLDTRKGEVVVGTAVVVVGAIVVLEANRLGAGWGPSGPQPGFFPRLAAVVMVGHAVLAMVQAIRSGASKPLFESAGQCREVLKVGGPIVAAVGAIGFVGFYIMTALYMALFALWYGRYRWYVAAALGIALPVLLFLTFERGFKISLPKSMWYGSHTPF